MRVILTAFLILAFATAAQAAVTVAAVEQTITAAAQTGPSGDPALVGARCWDIQVTTTGDLLGMQITSLTPAASLYNNVINDPPSNSDLKPNPLFFPIYPALEFDSYIDMPTTAAATPGTITILAGTLGTTTTPAVLAMDYVDTTNDGAQTNFVVARLTILAGGTPLLPSFSTTPDAGAPLVLKTQENVGGTPVITTWYNVPEPATMSLLVLGGLAAVIRRKR
jgi:hypothetical protein